MNEKNEEIARDIQETFDTPEVKMGRIKQALDSKDAEAKTNLQTAWNSRDLMSEECTRLRAESAQLRGEVATLRQRLVCSICGGTDLVCGKGHIEATDELKKQNRELRGEVERLKKDVDESDNQLHRLTEMYGVGDDSYGNKILCACNYDNPGDVCLPHSKYLNKKLAPQSLLIEKLRLALEPVLKAIKLAQPYVFPEKDWNVEHHQEIVLTVGECRAIKEALIPQKEKE